MTLQAGSLVHVPAKVSEKLSDDNLASAVVTKVFLAPVDSDAKDTVNVRVFSDNNEFEWRTTVTVEDTKPDVNAEGYVPSNVCWVPSSGSPNFTEADAPEADSPVTTNGV